MTGEFLFIFLAIGAVAMFTFLAVVTFVENRAKERIEYYKHETFKKLAEQTPEKSMQVLEAIRQDQRSAYRKKLEGMKLGGLITTMVGITLGIFLYWMTGMPVALVGLIPLGVGLAMLLYAFFMAPKGSDL